MNDQKSQRYQLLRRLEDLFEGPLAVLGLIWLILLIVELVYQTSPLLETLGVVIWIIFVLDFFLKFFLAPEKGAFLKANVLTAISLFVPALRIVRYFRIIRLLRFTRSLRLVKVLGSINRSMRILSATMKRRALGYVLLLTMAVILAGAAGMFAFEKDVDGGFQSYGSALWWTTMLMTTLGSEYWPQTIEGRLLCIVLAVFAFAVFGYITATIATYFIGRDAEMSDGEIAGTKQIKDLQKEVRELKQMMQNYLSK